MAELSYCHISLTCLHSIHTISNFLNKPCIHGRIAKNMMVMGIGKTVLSKMDEFSEKFQATFDPPKIISVDNMMRWKDDNICPPFPIMTRIHDNSSHLKKFTLTPLVALVTRYASKNRNISIFTILVSFYVLLKNGNR